MLGWQRKLSFFLPWVGLGALALPIIVYSLLESEIIYWIQGLEDLFGVSTGFLMVPFVALGIGAANWYLIRPYVSSGFLWVPACVLVGLGTVGYMIADSFFFTNMPLILGFLVGLAINLEVNDLKEIRLHHPFSTGLFSLTGLSLVFLYSSITGAIYSEILSPDGIEGTLILVLALLLFGGLICSVLSGIFFILCVRSENAQ